MNNEQRQTEEIYLFNNEGIHDVKADATAATTGTPANAADERTNGSRKDNRPPSPS